MNVNVLSALVCDERETIRDIRDGLTSLNPDFSVLNDNEISLSLHRNKYLAWLHITFSVAGLRLTDEERHYIFSMIFRRPIISAKELTDVEVLAWHRIMNNPKSAKAVKVILETMLDEYRTS